MPIKLDCPRCKTLLAVPRKKIGSYVHCPHCSGRFWVPKPEEPGTAATPPPGVNDGAQPGPASRATPPDGMPGREDRPSTQERPVHGFWHSAPAVPGAPAVGTPSPGGNGSAEPPSHPPPLGRSTSPLPPPRKVARFISAETADSAIKLAEDGKLPELRLKEPGRTDVEPKSDRAVHPLLLLLLLCMSVVTSTVLVFIDFEPQRTAGRQRAEQARAVIQEQYFANLDSGEPLALFEVYLREAQRAHSAGDTDAERERYRQVLKMLRVERGRFERGLTGSRARDRELEDQIAVILSQLQD